MRPPDSGQRLADNRSSVAALRNVIGKKRCEIFARPPFGPLGAAPPRRGTKPQRSQDALAGPAVLRRWTHRFARRFHPQVDYLRGPG